MYSDYRVHIFLCRTVSVSTPGSSGALNLGSTVQPGSTVRQAVDAPSDKALRYIEPPQQVLFYLLFFFNTQCNCTLYSVNCTLYIVQDQPLYNDLIYR